jgi:hypothetical protein
MSTDPVRVCEDRRPLFRVCHIVDDDGNALCFSDVAVGEDPHPRGVRRPRTRDDGPQALREVREAASRAGRLGRLGGGRPGGLTSPISGRFQYLRDRLLTRA